MKPTAKGTLAVEGRYSVNGANVYSAVTATGSLRASFGAASVEVDEGDHVGLRIGPDGQPTGLVVYRAPRSSIARLLARFGIRRTEFHRAKPSPKGEGE